MFSLFYFLYGSGIKRVIINNISLFFANQKTKTFMSRLLLIKEIKVVKGIIGVVPLGDRLRHKKDMEEIIIKTIFSITPVRSDRQQLNFKLH